MYISVKKEGETMKKNEALPDERMTPAGEDYLMKIHELSHGGADPVRIRDLSLSLGVTPSSASRMASAMGARGYLNFRRYGYITLTEKGEKTGAYMRKRLAAATAHLASLRGIPEEDVAEEAARVAHNLSPETVAALKENRAP